jgi:hypothetical protein
MAEAAGSSDSSSAAKKAKIRFDLRMSGSAEEKSTLFEKLHCIKDIIADRDSAQASTTYNTLMELFSFWLTHQKDSTTSSGADTTDQTSEPSVAQRQSSFILLNKQQSKTERIHLVTSTSLKELETTINSHRNNCPGVLTMDPDVTAVGFWNRMTLSCNRQQCAVYITGKFKWSMSPYVSGHGSGHDSYINSRMMHASHVAGLLPSQLERLTKSANITGTVSHFLRPSSTLCNSYTNSIMEVRKFFLL